MGWLDKIKQVNPLKNWYKPWECGVPFNSNNAIQKDASGLLSALSKAMAVYRTMEFCDVNTDSYQSTGSLDIRFGCLRPSLEFLTDVSISFHKGYVEISKGKRTQDGPTIKKYTTEELAGGQYSAVLKELQSNRPTLNPEQIDLVTEANNISQGSSTRSIPDIIAKLQQGKKITDAEKGAIYKIVQEAAGIQRTNYAQKLQNALTARNQGLDDAEKAQGQWACGSDITSINDLEALLKKSETYPGSGNISFMIDPKFLYGRLVAAYNDLQAWQNKNKSPSNLAGETVQMVKLNEKLMRDLRQAVTQYKYMGGIMGPRSIEVTKDAATDFGTYSILMKTDIPQTYTPKTFQID